MKDSKLGPRVFGLALVAALGLLAFSAVAAQAENLTDGGKAALFQIEGSGALVEAGQTFTGKLEKWTDGIVHRFYLIPKLNLSVLCEGLTVEEGKFLNDNEALAKIRYTGCKAFNLTGKEELATCVVTSKATGGEKGVILSLFMALPRKHEGQGYLLFQPVGVGQPFATVFFEKGKGCPLTLNNQITGVFAASVKEKEAVVNLITSNEAVQTLMFGGSKLLFGAQPAFYDLNATIELTVKHVGAKFGVV